MIRYRILAAAFIAGCIVAAPAFAHGYKLGDLVIGHPWARATPAGAPVGGGYLTIENTGQTPDRLVSISSDASPRAEVHQMSHQDGVMTMRPVEGGLVIPPGGKVELKPGGYHVMFMKLGKGLAAGETVKAVLTFEKAGSIPVEFKVEAVGAKPAPAPAAGEHATH